LLALLGAHGLPPGRAAAAAAPTENLSAHDPLQVRLFWLVNGAAAKVAPGLPDDLKELAAELSKLGLDQPRLATRLALSTTLNTRFEGTGVAALAAPHDLSVAGAVTAGKPGALPSAELQLTVSATREARRRGSRRVASLRTQVTVPLGRPVVLGVTPTEALTSAFVVQVVQKTPTGVAAGGPAKTFTFQARAKPWGDVFTWLTEQTGLPVVATSRPTGTFTFLPPAPGKKYTLPEVIDVLNEALLQKRLLLLRRERCFAVVPADEKIDPGLLERVRPEDLDLRGQTELVSVVIPLHSLQAEEFAPEVKKMLGPFGEVVALKKANRLVLQDTAGNLRRVYELIRDVEKRAGK
jgi:hypothetical protein